jgi:hypothetical protein
MSDTRDRLAESEAENDEWQRKVAELWAELTPLRALAEAVRTARVQRDPRHRVSMLVNDWLAIENALRDVA